MPANTKSPGEIDGMDRLLQSTEERQRRGIAVAMSLAIGTPSDFQRVRIIPDRQFMARTGLRMGIYGEERTALGLPKGGRTGIWWNVTFEPRCEACRKVLTRRAPTCCLPAH
jgi:hypothetical protein